MVPSLTPTAKFAETLKGSNVVTIYALLDPRDRQIRYVGKTKRTVEKRLYFHLKTRRKTKNRSWLDSLVALDLKPETVVLEIVDGSQCWQDRERFWIKRYRDLGCNLNNHTDGGDGIDNPDAELRAKWSRSQKRVMADPAHRAKVFTKENAAKISRAIRGVPRPWVKNLPQNQPGRKVPESFRVSVGLRMKGNIYRKGTTQAAWNKGLKTGKSSWNRGLHTPPETSLKISKRLTGRTITEAHRENIRSARLAYWAAKRGQNGTLLT